MRRQGFLAPVPTSGWRSPRTWPHSLVLIKRTQAVDPMTSLDEVDDWNQSVPEVVPLEVPFTGLLLPVSTMEQPAADAAGVAITTHKCKIPPAIPATKDDYVRWSPDDGRRYEIIGDPLDPGGRGHHLEAELHEVKG